MLKGVWVDSGVRDSVVMHIRDKKEQTGLSESFMLKVINVHPDKFNSWKRRVGVSNKHNGCQPRDYWLDEWEKESIIEFYLANIDEGYRRCCYLMIDHNIVYTSPSTVYRVLVKAAAIKTSTNKESAKGNGFVQPTFPHEHWHMDISYVKIAGVFYYLICILDGYSRAIVCWDIRTEMKDYDVGIVQQKAKELYPDEHPRYITDNGSQFIGKDFKHFIADNELTHWTTSPYYPQSNGKIERFHKTIKGECVKKKCPISLEDAKRIIGNYVQEYNFTRLHSAIGYVAPMDKMSGKDKQIIAERKKKVENRRKERKNRYRNEPELTTLTN